jgi:hypothetical protein
VALALRLWLVSQATWPPVSDTNDYHQLAGSLANGDGYVQAYEGSRPEYRGLTFRAFRMPGYPALLAGLYSVFSWDPMVGYAANIACELGTQVLLLALGQYYATSPFALAGAVLLARAAGPHRSPGDRRDKRPDPRAGVERELPACRAVLRDRLPVRRLCDRMAWRPPRLVDG